MPFQSKSQQGYMFAKHPKIAKRRAEETPNMKSLPKKAKPMKGATILKKMMKKMPKAM